MEGGAGADGFVFLKANESIKGAQRDKILGFTHADEIDLSGIDANTHKAGNQKFKFIGGQDFRNLDGELRFAGGILAGDTNGNGIADFEVKVTGRRSCSATWCSDAVVISIEGARRPAALSSDQIGERFRGTPDASGAHPQIAKSAATSAAATDGVSTAPVAPLQLP